MTQLSNPTNFNNKLNDLSLLLYESEDEIELKDENDESGQDDLQTDLLSNSSSILKGLSPDMSKPNLTQLEFKKVNLDRKMAKQLTERKRRDRINSLLNNLRTLIFKILNKNPRHHRKLEKADILELVVSFLKRELNCLKNKTNQIQNHQHYQIHTDNNLQIDHCDELNNCHKSPKPIQIIIPDHHQYWSPMFPSQQQTCQIVMNNNCLNTLPHNQSYWTIPKSNPTKEGNTKNQDWTQACTYDNLINRQPFLSLNNNSFHTNGCTSIGQNYCKNLSQQYCHPIPYTNVIQPTSNLLLLRNDENSTNLQNVKLDNKKEEFSQKLWRPYV